MTKLGNFELLEELGRGGFGTVYKAVDCTLGREVALKVLHPQLAADPEFIERFRREARLAAGLDHPNLVTVYQAGEVEGRFFLAMQLLSGGSLAARLKSGALKEVEILKILGQVCAGLEVLHEKGIVHRDLKPQNILFNARGEAVITDFGLARALSTSSASTSTGAVGTPFYRAPELWRGKPPASPATDIYSLGCILGEMLTGRVLFGGDTPDEVLTRHLIDGPEFGPDWPPQGTAGLAKVVEKAITRNPAGRYAEAGEFRKAVQLPALAAAMTMPTIQVPAPSAPVVQAPAPAATKAAQVNPNEMRLVLAPGVEMVFARVPAGEFLYTEKNIPVYLDEYWIGKYPVTNTQFRAFIRAANYPYKIKLPKDKDNHPVANVTWHDAAAFCTWAAKVNGQPVRLPSEAEWEKAARGTDGRAYPWGEQEPDGMRCNFNKVVGGTTSVGQFSPQGDSPYGCADITGNVWAWCADWYGDLPPVIQRNPKGPNNGERRILRGGSWNSYSRFVRVTIRSRYIPGDTFDSFGFRCALS